MIYGPRLRSSSTERQVSNWLNFISTGTSGSPIKTIQTGTVSTTGASTTGTATVSAVDTSNALLLWGGISSTESLDLGTAYFCRITLTNATTITATRQGTSSVTNNMPFTLIEFNPGILKSLQYGTVSFTGSTGTATISSVNTSKSILSFLGYDTNEANAANGGQYKVLNTVLTNSTTVTCSVGTGVNYNANFAVAEFN